MFISRTGKYKAPARRAPVETGTPIKPKPVIKITPPGKSAPTPPAATTTTTTTPTPIVDTATPTTHITTPHIIYPNTFTTIKTTSPPISNQFVLLPEDDEVEVVPPVETT